MCWALPADLFLAVTSERDDAGLKPLGSALRFACSHPIYGRIRNAAGAWVHVLVHTIDWLVHGLSWHNQPVSQHPLRCANVPVGVRRGQSRSNRAGCDE